MRHWSHSSDFFVGRRGEIKRYLICAMQGYFPVLIRTGKTEVAVIFRTGAPHYGVTGTLATAHSTDGGISWSDPIELAPRWSDVRNPAFGLLPDGRWLAAYWKAAVHCYHPRADTGELRWKVLPPDETPDEPGLFLRTTGDGGRTWTNEAPYRSELLSICSPFGRIVTLSDGTLVMTANGRPREATELGPASCCILRSHDGGTTWGDESWVAHDHNELSLCELPDGRLIGALRHTAGHTSLIASEDGGRTFSEPTRLTRQLEHPGDLCLLASGKLLLTFGRRRRPLGCGALLSDDGGATWDHDREVLLAGDGIRNDVGYPSTVQLGDETIVTAMYFGGSCGASESAEGWGEVSCQALRYTESQVFGTGG